MARIGINGYRPEDTTKLITKISDSMNHSLLRETSFSTSLSNTEHFHQTKKTAQYIEIWSDTDEYVFSILALFEEFKIYEHIEIDSPNFQVFLKSQEMKIGSWKNKIKSKRKNFARERLLYFGFGSLITIFVFLTIILCLGN
jgi:hypothetical protein